MEWLVTGGIGIPLGLVVVVLGAFIAYLRFDAKRRPGPQAQGLEILAFFFAPVFALAALLLLDLLVLLLMPPYLLYRALRRLLLGSKSEGTELTARLSSCSD